MASFLEKLKKRALKSNTNYQMNTAKKKKAVSGTMKGKQVDTTSGPTMGRVIKKSTAPKTSVVNRKTTGTKSEKTGPKMSAGTRKGNSVPGKRAVKKKASVADSMYGKANQGKIASNKSNAPSPYKKKKATRRRGPSGPTMTSFR